MNRHKYRHMLAEYPEIVMTVPPVPGGDMPWSGSNNLGNVVDFSPNTNNEQTILKLDEWGPPEIWTLSLGLTHDAWPDGTLAAVFEARALIDFGVGGSTQEVELSWLNGTMISMPMNAVNVRAFYGTPDFYGTTAVPPNLRVSAQLSRGYHHSNAVLLTPYNDGTIVSAAPVITAFDIPAFATHVKALPLVNNTVTGGFFDAANKIYLTTGSQNIGSFSSVQYRAMDVWDRWLEIPPYVRSIQYVDISATDPSYQWLWRIGV